MSFSCYCLPSQICWLPVHLFFTLSNCLPTQLLSFTIPWLTFDHAGVSVGLFVFTISWEPLSAFRTSTLNCALLASVIYVLCMNNNSTIPDSDYSVFICRRLRCLVFAANGWVHGFAFVSILNASTTLRTRLKGKNVSFLRPYSGQVCLSGKSMAEATKVVHFLRFHPE